MKLINNRYRLEHIYQEDSNGIVYLATDLFNSNSRVLLKMLNDSTRNKKVVDYFIDKFLVLSSLTHPNLVASYDFDIVETIDDKLVHKTKYFYTKAMIKDPILGENIESYGLKDVLKIILELGSVLDYLHFRQVYYKHVNPYTVFVGKDKKNQSIKLLDIASSMDYEMMNTYHEIDQYFMAPEVRVNPTYVDGRADIYSLGMLAIYLLSNGAIHWTNASTIDWTTLPIPEQLRPVILPILKKMIHYDPNQRYDNLRKLLDDANDKLHQKQHLYLKESREKLNFKIKTIGRNKEIQKIHNIDKDFVNRIYSKRFFGVQGENGIGKTKLLKRVAFDLRMKGRRVYRLSMTESQQDGLKPIGKVLGRMLKHCSDDLIRKYDGELVKVIPELRLTHSSQPTMSLADNREKLRLYDRITNFIVDFIKDTPTYIFIDDLQYANIEILNLMNYMIKNTEEAPLLLIAAYNRSLNNDHERINQYLEQWTSSKEVTQVTLLRLNLEETAEMIQNILGMKHPPMNFSTKIFKETEGNPRYIEEVIKSFYSIGELYISEKGKWYSKTENYAKLSIPANLAEAMKEQIKALKPMESKIVRVISVFDTSISKSTIQSLLRENQAITETVDQLVAMGILDQRVEDWGYTYDFYNIQTKRYIYQTIEEGERVRLHRRAAETLENLYKKEKRLNIDELIYHFTLSNQRGLAIDYAIDSAKRMESYLIDNHSISLWEKALELLSDEINERKLEVLYNLARLYERQGMIERSLAFFNQALDAAYGLRKPTYIVNCKNHIGEICYRRNMHQKVERYVRDAKDLAETIDYMNGYLEAIIILNRISYGKGKLDDILSMSDKYLKIARQHDKYKYIAELLNQKGVALMAKKQLDEAKLNYEESIHYFNKSGEPKAATKPINNLGVIYEDYYDDIDEAMTYLKKGMDIATKYKSEHTKILFLMNIGENYHRKYDFVKAKTYVEKAIEEAENLEDSALSISARITLGILNIYLGAYEEVYQIKEILQEVYKDDLIQWQDIGRYYKFMALFYLNLGDWNQCIKVCETLKEGYGKEDTKYELVAENIAVLARSFQRKEVDKAKVNQLLQAHKEQNSLGGRRYQILNFALLSTLYGDRAYALELLIEDQLISDDFPADFLDFYKECIRVKLNGGSMREFTALEAEAKKNQFALCQLVLNIWLGDGYFGEGKYYHSANYYVAALDFIQRMLNKIPNKKHRLQYAKTHGVDKLKNKLMSIRNIILGENRPVNYVLDEIGQLEGYFDFSDVEEIFENKGIYHTALGYMDVPDLMDLNSLDDLVTGLTNDYERNLQRILWFAMKSTFAERGFIGLYQETQEDMHILVSSDGEQVFEKKEIMALAKGKNNGFLIKKSLHGKELSQFEALLPDHVKSAICIPIFKRQLTNHDSGEHRSDDDRRKSVELLGHEGLLGYIYLDTSKPFNKFNEESYGRIKALRQLILINLDNYHLLRSSSIDKLTGAYTKKHLEHLFDETLHAAKATERNFSVIMMDIDKFKNVNDTFGHQKGDEVLNKASAILLDNIRKTDILGRYGGEEFIAILPGTTDEESKQIAEKLRKKIQDSQVMGANYSLTISLGVASYPKHGQFRHELIEKADQALYHAKKTGRNKSVVWRNIIGQTTNRFDKLAGVVSGNAVEDQRKVLAMVDIIDILKENQEKDEKIYLTLGRLIEIIEADQGTLILLDDANKIDRIYGRERFKERWLKAPRVTEKAIQRIIDNRAGEFFIDWENAGNLDIVTGNPNWQSVILVPLIYQDRIKGILQVSVPIKEKEFDYNSYNYIKLIGDLIVPTL